MPLEHFAEHWCSKMKDKESLFGKCHTSVNPDSYYKVWSETENLENCTIFLIVMNVTQPLIISSDTKCLCVFRDANTPAVRVRRVRNVCVRCSPHTPGPVPLKEYSCKAGEELCVVRRMKAVYLADRWWVFKPGCSVENFSLKKYMKSLFKK